MTSKMSQEILNLSAIYGTIWIYICRPYNMNVKNVYEFKPGINKT